MKCATCEREVPAGIPHWDFLGIYSRGDGVTLDPDGPLFCSYRCLARHAATRDLSAEVTP